LYHDKNGLACEVVAGVAQNVVGAVLVIFFFNVQFAKSSSQWETRVDYLKKYPKPC
jgi:hypothetical protein